MPKSKEDRMEGITLVGSKALYAQDPAGRCTQQKQAFRRSMLTVHSAEIRAVCGSCQHS